MSTRLIRAGLAMSSVLTASIIIGGMSVFVGGVLYRWLAEIAPPAVALACVIAGAVLLAALVLLLGHFVVRRAFGPSAAKLTNADSPDRLIAAGVLRLAEGSPVQLVAMALGVGFALGLSPRLRRVVYRSLVG